MKLTTTLSCALAIVSCLQAQSKAPQGLTPQPNQTDSALTAQTRQVFQNVTDNLLKSAKEMPEDKYGFRPADGVRSFGEMIAHIANVQSTLCGNINGHPARKAMTPASKDNVIKDLGSSSQECETAFDELSAQNVSIQVDTPAGRLTHLGALLYIITHASEEYGQLSIYLRLNHLSPPSSDQAEKTL
jgi:uncharacterized damage-inducible protein DinB